MKKIAFVILFITTLLLTGIKPQPIFAAVGAVCCPTDGFPSARNGACYSREAKWGDIYVTNEPWKCTSPGADPATAPGQGCNTFMNSGRGECFDLPQQIKQTQACPNGGGTCISTGIGLIHTDYEGFLGQVITFGIGLGAGIAFLMLIYGSYQLITSQGNPEGINHGKETITAAVVGLVFIALSVSVLQILGIDLLGLKNLGFGNR